MQSQREERRSHPRLAAPQGRVTVIARSLRTQQRIPLRLLDIGPGGLRFRGHSLEGRPLQGESLVVRLVTGDVDVSLGGRVVWLEDLSGGRLYVGAMHFDEMSDDARDKVARLIGVLREA